MSGIKLKRVTLTGVASNIEVTMETKCLKVMVKNLTDEDIYVGIGKASEVTTDNSVLIKSNCYQILMINEYDPEGFTKNLGDKFLIVSNDELEVE